MKTELIIANKSGGKMWEISNSVPEVTWSTERTGSPGTLKFNVLKAGGSELRRGRYRPVLGGRPAPVLRLGIHQEQGRWGEIQVTCYDRIRYLKANASYNLRRRPPGICSGRSPPTSRLTWGR
mgnify:CR=1 FL=1